MSGSTDAADGMVRSTSPTDSGCGARMTQCGRKPVMLAALVGAGKDGVAHNELSTVLADQQWPVEESHMKLPRKGVDA